MQEDPTISSDYIADSSSMRELFFLFKKAPFAMSVLKGTSLTIEMANEKLLEIWGKKKEEVIGKALFECFPELIGTESERIFRMAFETGRKFVSKEYETGFLRNGELYHAYFDLNIDPIIDPYGTVTGLLATSTEVTEQVVARKKIEESEKQYRQLVDGLAAAVYTCDREGNITMFNKNAVKIWGREPVKGKDKWVGWHKFYHHDRQLTPEESPMAIAVKEGRAVQVDEILVEKADGTIHTIIPHPRPLYNSKGEVIGGINVLIDITDRKKAEETLKTKLKEISDYKYALDESCIVAITNQKGIIQYANENFCKISKYSAAELIGQDHRIINSGYHPKEFIRNLWTTIANGKIWKGEIKNKAKDGTYFWVDTTIGPFLDEKGKPYQYLAIRSDITDRKLVEEKIAESEERLRMAFETAHIGAWEYNPFIQKLTCSDESRKICGIPEDLDPDFNLMLQYIYPADQDYFIECIKNSLSHKGDGNFDMLIRFNRYDDKQLRWVKAKGKVFFDKNHKAQKLIGTMMDVTEEKVQQESFQKILEFDEAVMNNMSEGLYTVDENGLVISMNPTAEKFFGWSFEELKGKKMHDLTHYKHRDGSPFPAEECAGLQVLKNGKVLRNYEDVFIKKDGTFFDVMYSSSPITINGKITGLIVVFRDITKMKQAEKALKESEEKNRLFIQHAPAAMAMFDKEMRYVSVSDQWMKEYDLEGNIIGKKHYELFPNINILERWKDVHSRCMKGATEKADEDFYYKDDGTPVWLKWEVYPWHNSAGEIGGIVIFTENISERKKTQQLIKENEERFRMMADEAPLFVWVTDEKLKTTYLNKAGLEYFNIDQPVDFTSLSWKKFIHPDDLLRVLDTMNDASENHQSYSLEMRLKNGKNGEYHWFLDKGQPRYENKRFVGFVGTSLDIHQRKEELEKVLESDKLKSDFIKIASHELKTPVTSIKGFVQLLLAMINEQDEKELSPLMVKSSLVSIERQVNRLTRLMSELLDLSRLEAGQLELKLEEHSLNELMIDIVQDIVYTQPKQRLNLYHEFECKINCDKDRFSQAVMNLLTNAIKYSPGADKIDITISKRSEDAIAVSIQDYGVGIEKKDLEKIFDRFYRVEGKTELTYPGFGIGLYIANEIIQLHNGKIEVKSEKGKGSIFTFTLPFKKKNRS